MFSSQDAVIELIATEAIKIKVPNAKVSTLKLREKLSGEKLREQAYV